MARDLTAPMLVAIAAPIIYPAYFVEIEVPGGTVNLWTGIGSSPWDGKTWIGLGRLMEVASIPETTTINAVGVVLIIDGIHPDDLELAMNDVVPNLPCTVWMGLQTAAGVLVLDPYKGYLGFTDSVHLTDGAETSALRINIESELIDLNRPRERRYTSADQKAEFPDDEGFDHVAELQNAVMNWGQPTTGQLPRANPGNPNIRDRDIE